MIFQNFTQLYPKSVANVRVRQQVRRQKAIGFPGGVLLWKSLGKTSLFLLLAVVSLSMVMTTLSTKNIVALESAEITRHELMDANIQLRAKKAHLMTEEQVKIAAEEKLSLSAPGKGKHYRFNS